VETTICSPFHLIQSHWLIVLGIFGCNFRLLANGLVFSRAGWAQHWGQGCPSPSGSLTASQRMSSRKTKKMRQLKLQDQLT